ncbi:MAG TPA: D-alanyl-D-alanine carboxypeptidase [Pseudolysinimonas sp.]|nr:D-alanyl-D-alanine carboxypeptidase [Pseudolysinimonas sp.]
MTDDAPISRRTALVARARSVGGGILRRIREHRTAALISAFCVVFVLLGTGAVLAGVAVGSASKTAARQHGTTNVPRSVPDGELAATRLRTCSVADLAADPRLKTLSGSVLRADTGEVLYDHDGATGVPAGNGLKVLTAAAAIATLGPDYKISTRVMEGSAAGTIVLVGHGDATLSAMPPGTESYYTGAPKLSSLAQEVITSWKSVHPGVPITSLVLDASYWNPADKWDPSWSRTAQTTGSHSEVTALEVDGDRADPTKAISPRGTDPIARAGDAFLAALRTADTEGIVADDVAISSGTSTGGTMLGEVTSQPLRVLLGQMLSNGDDTLAEMLARILSKESGMNGSAASLQKAIPSALVELDPSLNFATQLAIVDGSGLSTSDLVPPVVMAAVMSSVQKGEFGLGPVGDALPVAGTSGSLSDRFGGANVAVRGKLTGVTTDSGPAYSLSGYVTAADGTALAFSFTAQGDGIAADATEALDSLTAGVYACGDNLSNF